ncbi:lipopolysaccharide cholinephosphotransferase [Prevotella sp. ne3005]|nr:lipopolysaccharide cholinephosphotransferase [Prevotella sp. ne3005]
MQLIELDLLKEFDRVCRLHNISYVITDGTMLGAVRHHGFIPWDDDADICMLREDYERFKKEAMKDLNPDICFFQDNTTDPYYRWGYAKLRRSGTQHIRVGQEHLKCKTGIFIDIMPYDDIPHNLCLQLIQNFYCFCCRKILWSEVAKKNTSGFKKLWFSLLSHISIKTVYDFLSIYTSRSRNSSTNRVRLLLFIPPGREYTKKPLNDRYGMTKKWITERAEYIFEGVPLYGSRDYDGFLRWKFGDYMKLPPEDKRCGHAQVSFISFGEK